MRDCRFCDLLNTPAEQRPVENTLLDETHHFEWIPALGAFIEGYTLIVSKTCVLNTTCLESSMIDELDHFIQDVQSRLKTLYGIGSVVFEHGTRGTKRPGGTSVDHQHVHIVPVDHPGVLARLLKDFACHRDIRSMRDLQALRNEHDPYVYYRSSQGQHHVFEAPSLSSQYMRKVIAKSWGCPADWDWREKPFRRNIRAFVRRIVSSEE